MKKSLNKVLTEQVEYMEKLRENNKELLSYLKELVKSVNPQNDSDKNILKMCQKVIAKYEGKGN